MELEPKSVTKEDVSQSFKEGLSFIRKNLGIYLIMWMLLNINVYLSTIEPYWLLVSPIFFAITFIGVFELTCTLFVGYQGSTYKKILVSLKAALRTLIAIVTNHPFIMGFYLLIFYSLLMKVSFGIVETTNYLPWSLKSLSWAGLFLTGFYNLSTILRMGCIAMFMKDYKDYPTIQNLIMKARIKNNPIFFYTSMIGLAVLMIMLFTGEILSGIALMYFIVCGFFFFLKVFEPPMMKKTQEQEIELPNIVPEIS